MFGRRAPPPPPVYNPPPPYPVALLLVYFMWLCYLVAARNNWTMRSPWRPEYLWTSWPIALVIFLTAQHDLLLSAPRKRDLSDPTQSFVYALPVAGFGLLLCSEGVSWLFGMLGKQSAFASARHPVMSVHAVSFLYYVSEPGTESCVMFDAFGRPLHPLRYVLWTISVSAMCFSLYLVVEKLLAQSKELRQISIPRLRIMLIDALLGCYGTFVFGFLGSRIVLESTHLHNYCLFCLSSCCFYLMLHRLYTMLNFVTHTKYIILSGAAPQFQAVQSARATEKMRVLPSYPHSRSRIFISFPFFCPHCSRHRHHLARLPDHLAARRAPAYHRLRGARRLCHRRPLRKVPPPLRVCLACERLRDGDTTENLIQQGFRC